MMPAPIANDDENEVEEDRIVADPLSDELLNLWNGTATNNRGIFTELFRTVPSDLVSSWDQYKVHSCWIARTRLNRGSRSCRISFRRSRWDT